VQSVLHSMPGATNTRYSCPGNLSLHCRWSVGSSPSARYPGRQAQKVFPPGVSLQDVVISHLSRPGRRRHSSKRRWTLLCGWVLVRLGKSSVLGSG